MFNNKKGQGSLEYLLLIGGAVLVAAIVIALVISSAGQGGSQAGIDASAALCASTQNITGAVETKVISGTSYYCCNTVATAANARFGGATVTVLTEAAQNAAVANCTLAK